MTHLPPLHVEQVVLRRLDARIAQLETEAAEMAGLDVPLPHQLRRDLADARAIRRTIRRMVAAGTLRIGGGA